MRKPNIVLCEPDDSFHGHYIAVMSNRDPESLDCRGTGWSPWEALQSLRDQLSARRDRIRQHG